MATSRAISAEANPSQRVGHAWLALCGALGLHVTDETLTGFLSVYNPTVTALRAEAPWLPLPVFRFEDWLSGLIVAVLALSALSVFFYRGARWTRALGYAFAGLMTANAIGHTLGTIFGRTVATVTFDGPMPGFYSSPFLLAASIYLMIQLHRSRT